MLVHNVTYQRHVNNFLLPVLNERARRAPVVIPVAAVVAAAAAASVAGAAVVGKFSSPVFSSPQDSPLPKLVLTDSIQTPIHSLAAALSGNDSLVSLMTDAAAIRCIKDKSLQVTAIPTVNKIVQAFEQYNERAGAMQSQGKKETQGMLEGFTAYIADKNKELASLDSYALERELRSIAEHNQCEWGDDVRVSAAPS